jgi:hypothetical protein
MAPGELPSHPNLVVKTEFQPAAWFFDRETIFEQYATCLYQPAWWSYQYAPL